MKYILIILLCFQFGLNAQVKIESCCEIDCDSTQVYYWDYQSGVREQIWSGDFNVPQDDLRNIFNGAPDPTSYGTPSHPLSPNIDVITPSWANTNTANDPSNGTDQARWIGYFYADQDNTVIGDLSPQNGERFRVWLGECCSSPKVIYESPDGDDSPFPGGNGNGIGDFYTVDKGWHLLIVEVSDRAAFSGFYLTFNGVAYSGPSAQNKPILKCKTVSCDYVMTSDEFDCPPTSCQPSAIVSGSSDCEDCDETNELQTLTANGNATTGTTSITISNGNTVNIQHPPSSNPTINELYCAGDFETGTGRTGWWETWTPIATANVAAVTSDWHDISVARTSPDCITDMTVNVNLGEHYLIQRHNRIYLWIDYRLLVNGVAVFTKTYHRYIYEDETQDITPPITQPVQYQIKNGGSGHGYRLNVPASSTVQVQARTRFQVTASQTNSYARYIGGLRSEANFSFNPRTELTDITIASNDENYWILPELLSVSYGQGEAPEGAEIIKNKGQYQKRISEAEKQAYNQNIEFQKEIEGFLPKDRD